MDPNQRREYLFQRDYELEKQLDKTIKDAQPKPKREPEYKMKLLPTVITSNDSLKGTPEYYANRVLIDIALEQSINNTIKQAMYAVSGKTPEKSKSTEVSQEMVEDYKKEVMKPVVIGDKQYLYRPVDMSALQPLDLKPYPHGVKIPEAAYNTISQEILDRIELYRIDLVAFQNRREILEDRYTLGSSRPPFDEAKRRAELSTRTRMELTQIFNPGQKKVSATLPDKLIDKIIDKEMAGKTSITSLTNNKAQLDQVKKDILNLVNRIQFEEAEFRRLDAAYKSQDVIDEENRIREIEYASRKKQLADDFQSTFNSLNAGKSQIFREANETDDDFLTRLQNMGNMEIDPKDIEADIQSNILEKSKKNLLELTKDLSKAETVMKMLNNEERFRMNKMFPQIKKKYSEAFGLNNKDLSDVDMTQFIRNEVEKGQSLITPAVVKTTTEAQAGEPEETEALPAPEGEALPETKVSVVGLKLYTKRMTERDKYPELNLKILRTKRELIKQLVDNKIWNEDDIYAYLDFLKREPQVAQIAEAQIAEPVGDKQPMGGFGLKSQVFPQNFIFGKIAIDLNKLFYQNVLSIKKHNGHKIIGHRNKKVSDNFVEVIFKMVDDKPISQSDLRNINNERLIYDNLIVQSGLNKSKKIPTTIEQTSQEMKDRLGLIVGEIEAGNSNKKLLEELHELLFKMVRVYLISKSAASTYYNNIKKEFFSL